MTNRVNINDLTGRDRQFAQLAIKRGLHIVRHGQAWRVFGNGVDLLARRLGTLTEHDIRPLRES